MNRKIRKMMLAASAAMFLAAWPMNAQPADCGQVPNFGELNNALRAVVQTGGAGGLGNHMWAAVVNRAGQVCAVTFSGPDRNAQWPGSRLIAAQKANTANAFSLPGMALSTANLYSAVQPGGPLYGLQFSMPINPEAAYRGVATAHGQGNDPLVGFQIGGVNVFGGGLALYNQQGQIVGGIGVSGDTSCADHVIAWRVRDRLRLDNVPRGVTAAGADNMIFDISNDPGEGMRVSQSGWGHPLCGPEVRDIVDRLPATSPVGPAQPQQPGTGPGTGGGT